MNRGVARISRKILPYPDPCLLVAIIRLTGLLISLSMAIQPPTFINTTIWNN